MKRSISLFLGILLILLSTWRTCAETTELTVNGTGIVYVTADVAQVSLGVREMKADVREAQEIVNGKINAICGALKAMGVPAKDIQTESIYISGEYDYSSEDIRLIGYTASNTINIRTTEIDKIGAYIDVAFENGANSLENIGFSVSDNKDYMEQALSMAVENALSKAEVIAKAAGKTVSSIDSIEESERPFGSDSVLTSNSRAVKEEAAADTLVSAASLSVSASVTIRMTLEDMDQNEE